jgi:hypothetical protein
MALTADDSRVLEYLRGRGTGPVTLTEISGATGLRKITIRVCLYALSGEDKLCLSQWMGDTGTEHYLVEHLLV